MHLAGWNVVTATPALLGARQKKQVILWSRGEWLDAVSLILGLLGLGQNLCSHVRPLLSKYKLTLLEQICPKHFAKVSCTQACAHQACPTRHPVFLSLLASLSSVPLRMGLPLMVVRHP